MEGLNLDDGGDEEKGVEVGRPVTFSVDAAGAGEGTLELVVSTPSTTVKAEVIIVNYRPTIKVISSVCYKYGWFYTAIYCLIFKSYWINSASYYHNRMSVIFTCNISYYIL